MTPGWMEKSSISSFMTTPVPGMTTFEPKLVLMVAVQATQLPSASAVEKWVVCFWNTLVCQSGGVPWEETSVMRDGLILADSAFAYAGSTNPRGILTKSG